MLKRILLIGVIGVAGAAIQGDRAQAHLAGTTYVPTYRHIASYDCTGAFKVSAPLFKEEHLFECFTRVHEFDYLCANPQGFVNRGNSGPRSIVQFAGGQLTQADITDKRKNLAIKTLLLPETVLEAADQECSDKNRNWFASDELVSLVDVTLKTFTVDDNGNKVQNFEALLRCTTPTCPDGELCDIVDNPPPQGTPVDYACTLCAEAHCDKGEACPISTMPDPCPLL